jgi:hypothetical protein
MSYSDIQEFALFYVDEHNLPTKVHNEFYKFIKEGTDEQVKHLLITGEMKSNLSESDLEKVNEVGISNWSGVDRININASHDETAIAAAVIAAFAARAAWRAYKDHISKIGKQCSQYKHGTSERKACEQKAKNTALQTQINVLKTGMGKCTKSKDPAKCKASIQSKIEKVKGKIK